MKVNLTLFTNGKGFWTAFVGKTIATELRIIPSTNFKRGQLQVVVPDWNYEKHGLIYTDPVWLEQLKIALRKLGFDTSDIDYSEQGMQGAKYVDLDVGEKFLKSYYDLV